MSNLSGEAIKDTYGGVINIGPSGASASLQPLTDGLGNTLPLEVSTGGINFTGSVSGLTPQIKSLEVVGSDLILDSGDTKINITFANPFPSTNYSISFTYSLDPNNIGSSNEFWFSNTGFLSVYFTNKTTNGFQVVFPSVDITSYTNFLGYVTCLSLGEN